MLKTFSLFIIFVSLIGCASVERSWKTGANPIRAKLEQLNKADKEVRIAIVVFVETSFSSQTMAAAGFDVTAWKKSIQSEALGYNESAINEMNLSKLRVIDRYSIDNILSEQKLSSSGVITPSDVIKVGQLAGATHMMRIDFQRTPGKFGRVNDHITTRLIDIENGEVLATVWVNELK